MCIAMQAEICTSNTKLRKHACSIEGKCNWVEYVERGRAFRGSAKMQIASFINFSDQIAVPVAIPSGGKISQSRARSVEEDCFLARRKPAAQDAPRAKRRR